MQNLAIHIGFHKTGTSYLQNVVFNNIDNLNLHLGWQSHRELMTLDPKIITLISDEGISGSLWKGNYSESFYTNIERIKSLYGDPKILIGIRKHQSFITSIYKQFLNEKGFQSFNYIFNNENTGLIKHEDLILQNKIESIKKDFSSVHIYTQEDLLKDKKNIVSNILKFLEIPEKSYDFNTQDKISNISIKTKKQVRFLRRINKLNYSIESIHPKLGLYTSPYQKLGITPRGLVKTFFNKNQSDNFQIPTETQKFIKEYYSKDLEFISQFYSDELE